MESMTICRVNREAASWKQMIIDSMMATGIMRLSKIAEMNMNECVKFVAEQGFEIDYVFCERNGYTGSESYQIIVKQEKGMCGRLKFSSYGGISWVYPN